MIRPAVHFAPMSDAKRTRIEAKELLAHELREHQNGLLTIDELSDSAKRILLNRALDAAASCNENG